MVERRDAVRGARSLCTPAPFVDGVFFNPPVTAIGEHTVPLNGGRGGLRGEQPGSRDPVELGHADVHEDDVGPVEVNRAEHLAAAGGLAHHVELCAPASIIRRPERTSASSSTSRTRIIAAGGRAGARRCRARRR